MKAPPCLQQVNSFLRRIWIPFHKARMGNNVPQRVKSVQFNIPPADFRWLPLFHVEKRNSSVKSPAEVISSVSLRGMCGYFGKKSTLGSNSIVSVLQCSRKITVTQWQRLTSTLRSRSWLTALCALPADQPPQQCGSVWKHGTLALPALLLVKTTGSTHFPVFFCQLWEKALISFLPPRRWPWKRCEKPSSRATALRCVPSLLSELLSPLFKPCCFASPKKQKTPVWFPGHFQMG